MLYKHICAFKSTRGNHNEIELNNLIETLILIYFKETNLVALARRDVIISL